MSVHKDDFYITLSSDKNSAFPDNEPGNFQVQLDRPLNLEYGSWKVGLSGIQFPRAIANINSETTIKLFTGNSIQNITFPDNCFTNIQNLTAFLNHEFKNISFESVHSILNAIHEDTLQSAALEYENKEPESVIPPDPKSRPLDSLLNENKAQNEKVEEKREKQMIVTDSFIPEPETSPEQEETDSLEIEKSYEETPEIINNEYIKPDADHTPEPIHRYYERHSRSVPDTSNIKQSNWMDLEHPPSILNDYTTFTWLESEMGKPVIRIPDFPGSNKSELEMIEAEIKLENIDATKKITIDVTDKIFKNIFPEAENLQMSDAIEPPVYSLNCEFKEYTNFIFQSASPDYDLGISDNLRNILGFSDQSKCTLKAFNRRRFFHTYLKMQARNILYLQGKRFQWLRTYLLKQDQEIVSEFNFKNDNTYDYWLYIIRLLNNVLDIRTENVWYDFNKQNNNIAYDYTEMANNSEWPQNTKWKEYFNSQDFFDLVNRIEYSLIDQTKIIAESNDRQIFKRTAASTRLNFRIRGAIISYYMLKVLAEELPAENYQVRADIMPLVSYPNSLFFIYSDIVELEFINAAKARLLAIIQVAANSSNDFIQYTVNPIQYKECVRGVINNLSKIHIYIYSLLGKTVKFQRGPVFIELHFKREGSI